MVCSPVKRVFFVYCVIQGTVDRRPALSLNKNASALVVTESEKG